MFAQVTAAMLVGSLQLFPCWGAPPLNDNFADRTVLEGDDLMIRGTLLGASLESDSDGHSERGLGNFDRVCGYSLDLVESGSLWWSWRAPRSGAVFLLPNEVRAPSAYCSPTFACWDSDRAGPRFPLDDNPEGPIAQLQTGTERPRYPYASFSAQAGKIYWLSVMGARSDSFSIRLRMLDRPFIEEQPTDRTLLAEESTFLAVVATGLATNRADGTSGLRYQWDHDGVNLVGQTSPVLLLSNASPSSAGGYRVVVSDIQGSVTSSVAQVRLRAAEAPPRLTFSRDTETPGEIAYELWGERGRIYRIESSTNLINWVLQPVKIASVSRFEPNMITAYPMIHGASHVLLRNGSFGFRLRTEGPSLFLRAQRYDPRHSFNSTVLWMTQFAKEAWSREYRSSVLSDTLTFSEIAGYLNQDAMSVVSGNTGCGAAVAVNTVGNSPAWPCLPEDFVDFESLPYHELVNPDAIWNAAE